MYVIHAKATGPIGLIFGIFLKSATFPVSWLLPLISVVAYYAPSVTGQLCSLFMFRTSARVDLKGQGQKPFKELIFVNSNIAQMIFKVLPNLGLGLVLNDLIYGPYPKNFPSCLLYKTLY